MQTFISVTNPQELVINTDKGCVQGIGNLLLQFVWKDWQLIDMDWHAVYSNDWFNLSYDVPSVFLSYKKSLLEQSLYVTDLHKLNKWMAERYGKIVATQGAISLYFIGFYCTYEN